MGKIVLKTKEDFCEFDSVVSHEEIKSFLVKNIEHQTIFHSYIFFGIKGIGKFKMARIFANILTKNNPKDTFIIDREFAFSVAENKTSAMSVDLVRQIKLLTLTRPISRKKVFIIDDSSDLTISAQNALLKILEEPPFYCVFVLIVSDIKMILPTVISRSVVLGFKKLENQQITDLLKNKFNVSSKIAILCAQISKGSLGNALIYSNNESYLQDRTMIFEVLFDFLSSGNSISLYKIIPFALKSRENLDFIFLNIESFFADLLKIKYKLIYEIVNVDKIKMIEIISKQKTTKEIVYCLECVSKCRKLIYFKVSIFAALTLMFAEFENSKL